MWRLAVCSTMENNKRLSLRRCPPQWIDIMFDAKNDFLGMEENPASDANLVWNRKYSVLQWEARICKLVNPAMSATTIRDLSHMRCDMLRTMWCTIWTVVFSGRRLVVTKVCQSSKWPLHLVFTCADCYIYGKMCGLGVPPLPALDNASTTGVHMCR